MTYPSKEVYEGEFVDGLKEGFGILRWSAGRHEGI